MRSAENNNRTGLGVSEGSRRPFRYYNATLIVISVVAAILVWLIAHTESASAQTYDDTYSTAYEAEDSSYDSSSLGCGDDESECSSSGTDSESSLSSEVESEIDTQSLAPDPVYISEEPEVFEFVSFGDTGVSFEEYIEPFEPYADVPENVPNWDINCDSNRKLYMYYTSVTDPMSAQYALLNGADAYTDVYSGIRMVGGRYCIALGSYYTTTVGQKVDVVLEDGSVIYCIVGDCKNDIHTNDTHQYALGTGNVVEFIVDSSVFDYLKDSSGTVNWVSGLDGKVTKIVLVD